MPMSQELAYADVLAAWQFYLANDNHGRGFVLVGHSQGTGVLSQLVREEIDGKPIQSQMVSALLMGGGGRLAVKPGDTAALIFPHTPALSDEYRDRLHYWASRRFARKPRRSAGTLFEKSPEGAHPACANPAALSGREGVLDAYLSASGETLILRGEGTRRVDQSAASDRHAVREGPRASQRTLRRGRQDRLPRRKPQRCPERASRGRYQGRLNNQR